MTESTREGIQSTNAKIDPPNSVVRSAEDVSQFLALQKQMASKNSQNIAGGERKNEIAETNAGIQSEKMDSVVQDDHDARGGKSRNNTAITHSKTYPKPNHSTSVSDKSTIPALETPKLVDPAELEKETQKYYEEVLGVTRSEEGERPSSPGKAAISSDQVASITKKFDLADVEKEKEKSQQEQIQTAWSILHQYWEFVRENPYDFNGWTYLLTHVENMDSIEAARSAFDGFLPLYPYCFAYWKRLSDIELKHKELERSLGVLLIGTQCIPFCMDLWMPLLNNFISYAKEKALPPGCVRELYEYGLKAMGISWQSSSFWEGCISYELHAGNLVAVMLLYRRLLGTPTKLYNKHWDHFLALVRDHHPRNLLSVEDYEALRKQTCEELKVKYTPTRLLPPKSLKKTPQPEDKLSSRMKEKLLATYIKTHESNEKQVDKRWKYEERIKRPYFHIKSLDKKQIKNWKDYLEYELKEGDPVRIVSLFERCLVSCAMYEDFWCQYAVYLEKHVQNIIDGKYKDYKEPVFGKNISDESEKEKVENEYENSENKDSVSDKEGSEIISNDNIPSDSVSDVQVNNKSHNVDVKNVDINADSLVRGSGTEEQDSNGNVVVIDRSSVEQSKSDVVGEQNSDANSGGAKTVASDQSTVPAEPLTIEQIKCRLCANLSLDERVLKCALLTPMWIMTGVSWEDVRQIYRRGAWIHCPSKPSLLMQWAEFEEMQGNLETARELLNTVIAKYPTLLKGRMHLIELERRAGCYSRVEELYGEASQIFTASRQRSWLAIKYARFLFKVLMEPDRALAVLRKALKKDRGYVHLYHHVFDICYQRQPLDCQGVLASVLLALSSKDLPVEDKYWFAYKRAQFLREHGSMLELKAAMKEEEELKEQAGLNVPKEIKGSSKKGKETLKKEEEEKKPEVDAKSDESEKKEEKPAAAASSESSNPVPDPLAAVPHILPPPPTQQFPVPFFASDGAITYSPMEGYGYGHTDPGQILPTAQEVVQGGPTQANDEINKKDYHNVPPSWEIGATMGSYGYGTSGDYQWGQQSGHRDYENLVSKGYPTHMRDHETEEPKPTIPIKIDHLRKDHIILPDLTQPPPGLIGPPRPSNRVLLPTPPGVQGPPNKTLLPTPSGMPGNFSRPPPSLGMGPPGLLPPGYGPPGGFQDSFPPGEEHRRIYPEDSSAFAKRPPPRDFCKAIKETKHEFFSGHKVADRREKAVQGMMKSNDEPPSKMPNHGFNDLQGYRAEFDNNYTLSPGPSAPPSHRANFGTYGDDYNEVCSQGRRENEPLDRLSEERKTYDIENSRLNDPNRYSLREENYDSSIPREMTRSETELMCVNVPDWLIKEGGELRLSDTNNGTSIIRYWPSFMTTQGHPVLFRVLRKKMKWYQRRALVEGQWHNLPHLLSWIGPFDYSYSGMTLEKNTDWLPEIVDLLHRLIKFTDHQYNCCYMALYRNGYDNAAWTSEDHVALRKNPSIASVSLGATRVFEMRMRNGSGYLQFPLFPGSLLLMEGATQEDWSHQLPKQPNVAGERIHLIFRKFYMIEGVTV
ncbi:PRP39 pre-mRNA processing factor 39 [Halocaridina rubra]|uniref:PRP39 pre-mRNA processing factor 39 n=1 Tax=Halocaridina rubra TaxID=373956 RepID=A0AAN8X2X8_HALRR